MERQDATDEEIKRDATSGRACTVRTCDNSSSCTVVLPRRRLCCAVMLIVADRGVVRNTKWVIGLVIYTGHESKEMLNTSEGPYKLSQAPTLS